MSEQQEYLTESEVLALRLADCAASEMSEIGETTVTVGDLFSAWSTSLMSLGIWSICGIVIGALWIFLAPTLLWKALIFVAFFLIALVVNRKIR